MIFTTNPYNDRPSKDNIEIRHQGFPKPKYKARDMQYARDVTFLTHNIKTGEVGKYDWNMPKGATPYISLLRYESIQYTLC